MSRNKIKIIKMRDFTMMDKLKITDRGGDLTSRYSDKRQNKKGTVTIRIVYFSLFIHNSVMNLLPYLLTQDGRWMIFRSWINK